MPSSAKFIVLESPTPGEEIDLSLPELVIGRDPSASLIIPSPVVSRRHARLDCCPQGCTLFDLGSSNGTRLNGTSINKAELKPGDLISLGQT